MTEARPRTPPQQKFERGTSFSPTLLMGLVALVDAAIMLVSGGGIYIFYVGIIQETSQQYMTALFLGSVFLLISFKFSKLYQFEAVINPVHHASKASFICLLVFLVLVAMGFALKISAVYSRIWFFSWAVSAPVLIYLTRMFCFYVLFRMAQAGRLTRNIAIVGGTEQAKRLLKHLDLATEPWNNVIGIFDDRGDRIGKTFAGYPVLGPLKDLVTFTRDTRVDDIIITLPWSAEMRLSNIVAKLVELPLDIHLGSDIAGLLYPGRSFSLLGGIPMLNIANKPMEGWDVILKGAEDRILALIFIIIFSPVMILVAIAIKLESEGPVLFHQPRYGFNNKEFDVFKFRSMYHNRPSEKGVTQATRGDSRVTRVGAFIRRSSIDELPQLFNVLQGTMSLVGPRPHAVQHNVEYAAKIDGYFARHKVKPGITGWAQVNGLRGETDTLDKMEARIELDLYYIDNWSIIFDLKVLAMTAIVVLFQKNVY